MADKMSVRRYTTNPFLEGMVVPVKGKSVKLSRLGTDDNVLVNQATGEVQGTHVVTYKKVDQEQFVKLFTANIALTFDLNAAGIKAFNILTWAVQSQGMGRDEVDLDQYTLEAFLANHPGANLSIATLRRGLRALEAANIIARTRRAGRYFINPNFIFNGDRVAFTTLIERKKATEEDQLDLLGDQQ